MAQNWTLLVDQFYSAANALIAKENLNVAFILDGVGTPGGGRTCLNNMWTDWCSPADSRNCTYIPPTDPIEASFSNNPEFGFERFQVLNPFLWPLVDWFASKDYYKFGQQSEYPVLYWEPSTQRNIQQVAEIFAQGPQVAAGFRFAINIDLVMFQVFAGRYSEAAWNFNLSDTAGLSSPLVTVLSGAQTTGQDVAVAVAYSEASNSTTFLLFGIPNTFEQTLWNTSSALPLPQPLSIFPTSTGLSLWTADGNFDVVLAGNPLGPKLTGSSNFGGKAFSILGAEDLLVVYSPGTTTFSLVANKNGWQPVGSAFSLLAACPGLTATQITAVASLTNTSVEAVIFYSCNLSVFILPLTLDFDGPSITTPVSGSLFDVGSHPSASLARSPSGVLTVIEVHSDGYCWNSNTNNKQAEPGLCDQTPVSLPQVMVYNYGSLAAFQSPSAGYVSSCSPQILHGTYDWGDFPSVFLWGADELRVLELHVGLPASVEDIGLCGIADPFDGLKLDAWPLRALSAK